VTNDDMSNDMSMKVYKTVNYTIWRREIDYFRQARSFDVRNYRFCRFQHQFCDFILFDSKKAKPAEIRTHDSWIRFQHNKNYKRPSDHGYSNSLI
jgi:hypothetical protein